MPIFVHLASHRSLRSIRRSGIRLVKRGGGRARGVYALPVTRNFQVAHQWLRELRRHGGGTMLAVYFRLPDEEAVEIGHFGGPYVETTAAEAAATMLEAERLDPAAARAADSRSKAVRYGRRLPSSPEGFEVVIPRAVSPSEILRVKGLPQVVGWRYRPGANGTPPVAFMEAERGAWGLRRLERRVEAAEAACMPVEARLFSRSDESLRRVERLRKARERKSG